MKIKIKLESLENILNLSNSFCTIPIIMDKSMMFGAYGVDLNMSEYIWYQLPEECKNKVYNYKEHTIKAMIITITNISAYSVSLSNHEKFKESITMEEFFEDFSENKKIERFLCECDFPYSNMSVYFQNLGEIYTEFELEDWVYHEKEAKKEWKISERERRKIREIYKVKPKIIRTEPPKIKGLVPKEEVIQETLLEKINEERFKFEQILKKFHKEDNIPKESLLLIFEKFPLLIDREIDSLLFNLKYIMLIIKSAEKLKIAIPESIRSEIGYWLTDMQAKIRKEEEENLFKEIRDKLNLKKVYKSRTYEFF